MALEQQSEDLAGELIRLDEKLDAELNSTDYVGNLLVETFNEFEQAMLKATQAGVKTIESGFTTLAEISDRAREVAGRNEEKDLEGFFVGKSATYRTLLETVTPKLSAQPRPSDPDDYVMSRPKRIR